MEGNLVSNKIVKMPNATLSSLRVPLSITAHDQHFLCWPNFDTTRLSFFTHAVDAKAVYEQANVLKVPDEKLLVHIEHPFAALTYYMSPTITIYHLADKDQHPTVIDIDGVFISFVSLTQTARQSSIGFVSTCP